MTLRRTMLYIPGINPKMLAKAPDTDADSVLLDLEDSVAPDKKAEARELVRDILSEDFGRTTKTVRINGMHTPYSMEDLKAMVPAKPDAVRIPKIQSKEDVETADDVMTELEKIHAMDVGSIKIHAMIETALGVENAFEIAKASPRVDAITIGGQDLTADMGIQKTESGIELAYARGRIVMAAKAAGVAAIDTVYADVKNEEGLLAETKMIRDLGFDGKAVIHPRQIAAVHGVFTPTDVEIAKAQEIVDAFNEAKARGVGVFTIGTKMIDAPVVARAEKVLELARECGMV